MGALSHIRVLDLTRVRAGPFGNREAAEKALEKMKQVGVSGVISGK